MDYTPTHEELSKISNTSSNNLSLLSLGSVNSHTSVESFLESDSNLLSTESTLIECVAYIWSFAIERFTDVGQSSDNSTLAKTDSSTFQDVKKLKEYFDFLNTFTKTYKEKKTTDLNFDEVSWINSLEKQYKDIQNNKPVNEDIIKIFTLVLESQSLRKMFMPNDLEPDSSGLNLTPEQIKLFKIEVVSNTVNIKLGKLLKVEQVIHNLMSRLKLRKLVLNRSRRTSPNIPVGEQQPTFAEKFLDVVHNIDTALTWIDEPEVPVTDNIIDHEIELKELRDIRATILTKLTSLQSELTGQPCEEHPTQEAMDLAVSNNKDENNSSNSKKRSTDSNKLDKTLNPEKKPCVTKTHITPVVRNAIVLVTPIEDTTIFHFTPAVSPNTKITNILSDINKVKHEFTSNAGVIVQELIQNETQELSEPVPSNDEVMLDINFILGIYTPESPASTLHVGGKRKKPHKITRRNKQKGSNRRRPNKKRKTAKRVKRFTKKH
jgi:hypothetical protein